VKQSLKCWTEPKLLPNTLRPGEARLSAPDCPVY
jgi:hypothetical protein